MIYRISVVAAAVIALFPSGRAHAADADLAALVAQDVARPVRPAGVDGQPVWNDNAIWFQYPPILRFSDRKDVHYSVRVFCSDGTQLRFRCKKRLVSFVDVWGKIPPGKVEVWAEATQPDHGHCIRRYFRTFWKMAPFRPGAYPKPARTYRQAAEAGWRYIANLPQLKKFLATGKPDPGYKLNCYPSKIHSAVIAGMIDFAAAVPEESANALALARVCADYLLSVAEPADAPLAHFTPTYEGSAHTAREFRGQTMLAYPAVAASAFARLYGAVKDARYLEGARNIAETYMRLQEKDGTWPLKLYLKNARPVNVNRLHPTDVIDMFDRLFALTGDGRYREAAARAFAFFENGPMKDWNWDGQFEDIRPKAPYENLTKHPACWVAQRLVRTCPGDKRRLGEARELLRFAEDQFVGWQAPFTEQRIVIADNARNYDETVWLVLPCVVEQYNFRVPIDASAARLIRTYLALYRASGNPLDLAKARALGDSCVKVQSPDGRIPTAWQRRNNPKGDWLNCMLSSIGALHELSGYDENH